MNCNMLHTTQVTQPRTNIRLPPHIKINTNNLENNVPDINHQRSTRAFTTFLAEEKSVQMLA